MHIKSILAGAAIALAAAIGSASADEQFSTLAGVTAVAMSSGELDAVVAGAPANVQVTPPGAGAPSHIDISPNLHSFPLLNFKGLLSAEKVTNGVIDVCGANGGCG